jgi:hypothetical protein
MSFRLFASMAFKQFGDALICLSGGNDPALRTTIGNGIRNGTQLIGSNAPRLGVTHSPLKPPRQSIAIHPVTFWAR